VSKPIAIVAGYLVRFPLGGHLMSQIHFLAGLRRLGFDVVFVEHHGWSLSCYDPHRNVMTDDPTAGLAEVNRVFEKFGGAQWKLSYADAAGDYHGLSRDQLARFCHDSTVLLSIATTTWLEEFRECKKRVFLDIDPGFTQFRMPPTPTPSRAGYASPYDFQYHFTFGEQIGKADCLIPTHGLHWQSTRQPVVMELIEPRFTPLAETFTTVMSWTAYGDTVYGGETYGSKDVEMLKMLNLPERAGKNFEVALGGPNVPAQKLREAGWVVTDALKATENVEAYLDFIGRSRGEFSVAKEGYVKTRCGWFSDRTASYLATGKPAIVQDTGFSEIIPCGEGLFAFRSADDVVTAIEAIAKDYRRHCRAARRIAEEYFDSDKVLGALLRQCDLPVAG
jgi:hypothetical protein